MMVLSVPSRSIGMSLGFASVIESITMTVLPVFIGEILEYQNYEEFQVVIKLFLGLSILYLVVNFCVMVFDLRNGKLLYLMESDERVDRLRKEIKRRSDVKGGAVGLDDNE